MLAMAVPLDPLERVYLKNRNHDRIPPLPPLWRTDEGVFAIAHARTRILPNQGNPGRTRPEGKQVPRGAGSEPLPDRLQQFSQASVSRLGGAL